MLVLSPRPVARAESTPRLDRKPSIRHAHGRPAAGAARSPRDDEDVPADRPGGHVAARSGLDEGRAVSRLAMESRTTKGTRRPSATRSRGKTFRGSSPEMMAEPWGHWAFPREVGSSPGDATSPREMALVRRLLPVEVSATLKQRLDDRTDAPHGWGTGRRCSFPRTPRATWPNNLAPRFRRPQACKMLTISGRVRSTT